MSKPPQTWRERWYEVIFEADTPAGKAFDVVLLIAILLSVFVVMLDSVPEINTIHADLLDNIEWFFTILFTVEYVARIACSPRPWRYVTSYYGIVDFLSILPTYLIFIMGTEAHELTVIRALRLLRTFRILKLGHMVSEATALRQAIWMSRSKIAVFISFVVIMVVLVGSAMYLIEGKEHGFDSIPISMYWTVVTMTTVGYGDIAPETLVGRVIAAFIMVLGYSMIIVPTGIVTSELAQSGVKLVTTQVCPNCQAEGHDVDAKHCKYCGGAL